MKNKRKNRYSCANCHHYAENENGFGWCALYGDDIFATGRCDEWQDARLSGTETKDRLRTAYAPGPVSKI